MRHYVAFLGLLVLCVFTASCVTSTPQEHDARLLRIEVMPPTGIDGPMARTMAEQLTQALRDRGGSANVLLPGETPGTGTDIVLTGDAEIGDVSGDGRFATVTWRYHRRGEGAVAGVVDVPVFTDATSWAYGAPDLIRTIALDSVVAIAPDLGLPAVIVFPEQAEESVSAVTESENVQTETVANEADKPLIAVDANPSLWIDEVTGAPGDGNATLTRELRGHLREAGHVLARTPSAANYFVMAVVDVSVIDNSTEHVSIVWSVRDRRGAELGRISQNNDIPRGILHGEWGDTARYAALGGAQGVQAILIELGHSPPTP